MHNENNAPGNLFQIKHVPIGIPLAYRLQEITASAKVINKAYFFSNTLNIVKKIQERRKRELTYQAIPAKFQSESLIQFINIQLRILPSIGKETVSKCQIIYSDKVTKNTSPDNLSHLLVIKNENEFARFFGL